MPRRRRPLRQRRSFGASLTTTGVLLVIVFIVGACAATPVTTPTAGSGPAALTTGTAPPPLPRTLEAYRGQGAWVDVFDILEVYAKGAPSITPDAVDDMAARGVHTLFLQAARWDDDTPAGIVDPKLLWRFLSRAHKHGMYVVGWYLPHFGDVERDLDRLRQVRDFSHDGEQFDGIGIDIEYTEGVPDVGARNAALIEVVSRFRAETTSKPIGAVVLPAVQIEVVNKTYWPDFPYRQIAPSVDIWQPMAYWSFRDPPYDDGYLFVKESIERLRNNLGDPAALTAPIGGVADETKDDHMAQFADALRDTGSVGGGMYDWNTLNPGRQWLLKQAFDTGSASALPRPPSWTSGTRPTP